MIRSSIPLLLVSNTKVREWHCHRRSGLIRLPEVQALTTAACTARLDTGFDFSPLNLNQKRKFLAQTHWPPSLQGPLFLTELSSTLEYRACHIELAIVSPHNIYYIFLNVDLLTMKAKFKLASHKKYKANSKSLKPATSTNPAFSIVEYKSKKYEELSLTPTKHQQDSRNSWSCFRLLWIA